MPEDRDRARTPDDALTVALAPDSFKGTLDAWAAAAAMERGVREALPGARCAQMPLGDGGEGTAAILAQVTGGERHEVMSEDPLGRPIRASVFRLGGAGERWALDTAEASGLARLSPAERDPLRASSAGTGRLILAVLERGAREVILGLGGSATVDGGVGLCRALGFRFLNSRGQELSPGGGALVELARIDASGVGPEVWRLGPRLRLAYDVQSPLLGSRGAARVFGPQKGASAEAVERLERGLARLAEVLGEHPGPCGGVAELATLPGAGAAGGIGATLRALLGASLEPGGALVIRAAGYCLLLDGCDLALVGEGRLDGQTLEGKAPAALAVEARRRGIPVLGVTGIPGPGIERLDFLEDWEAARAGPPGEGSPGAGPPGAWPPGAGPPGELPDPVTAAQEVAAATARLVRRWLAGPPASHPSHRRGNPV